MRAEDVDLRELLSFDPDGGIMSFGGHRVVLLDPFALGVLRKMLVEHFGLTAARGLLTQHGYAHGWRTAESMKNAFPWDDERQWRIAGGRLHRLMGLVAF